MREGDSAASSQDPDPAGSLRARGSQVSSEHPDVIIPTVGVKTVHNGAPQSVDVNAFLIADFQSPETTPTADYIPQITPSTLAHPHLSVKTAMAAHISPLPLHLGNPQHSPPPLQLDDPARPRSPVLRQAAPAAAQLEPLHIGAPADLEVQALGRSDSPLQQNNAAPHYQLAVLRTPLRNAAAQLAPLHIDAPADQEVQALVRSDSPLQDMGALGRRFPVVQTPVRDTAAQFRPAHSPIGRLQYSPETVSQRPSTTPVDGKEREPCVPCYCPKPLLSLAEYRLKYPSVQNRHSFFKEPPAVHDGKPLEFVLLSLDSKDKKNSSSEKQRIEQNPTFKMFIGGQKKKGGQSASSQTGVKVDVQLASLHHPQCVSLTSVLPVCIT